MARDDDERKDTPPEAPEEGRLKEESAQTAEKRAEAADDGDLGEAAGGGENEAQAAGADEDEAEAAEAAAPKADGDADADEDEAEAAEAAAPKADGDADADEDEAEAAEAAAVDADEDEDGAEAAAAAQDRDDDAQAAAEAEARAEVAAAPADEPAAGFLLAVREGRQRRKLKREGRYLLKELRRILRSKARREHLSRELVVEGRAAVAGLEAALKRRPLSSTALSMAIGRVEELIDGPLAFARKSTLREYVEAIAVAGVVALVLRFFVIQPFKIPSGSMIPTLEVGDHIFVNKFSYGLQVPFTKDPPLHFVSWGEPERGEVVVFIHRQNGQDFIKRVVAVGGDRIKVKNEQIHLQRGGTGPWKKVPQRRLPGPCSHMDYNEHGHRWESVTHCTLLEETLGDHEYRVVHVEEPERREMPDYPPLDEFRRTRVPVGLGFMRADRLVDPYRVPADSVFVMGDNRRNSTDSRVLGEVGFIGRKFIRGRALLVWWSWGPKNSVRFSRVGTLVR